MALDATPTNFRKVGRAIGKALELSVTGARKGFLPGGLVIQRQAQLYVPVEYGELRGSAFVRVLKDGVEVGFTAAYAVYVHENMQQKLKGKPRPSGLGVYWGPAGGPKFLTRAVQERRDEFVEIVAASAKREVDRAEKAK